MSKLISMSEAIKSFVNSGDSLIACTCMEQKIPFSAGHEIIRQGIKELTLLCPISDVLYDQMIGAGCVTRMMPAWVGNVMMGSAYNFRRAVEKNIPHPIEVIDYSNLTMACAIHAGAMGIPYMPTRSLLGSDILKGNDSLLEINSPFDKSERLCAVKALNPDVGIFHVQRADKNGSSHTWGNIGITSDAALAAKKVIIVAEEIVDSAVIESDPNRTVIPGLVVDAVVHDPFGAHPSPVQGAYNRDHKFYTDYHQQTRERDGFKRWLEEWVYGVEDRSDYCEKLGRDCLNSLKIKVSRPAVATEFGY
ncbi:MAG: CoA transferase subunit A [candidate division Zixibacteria bacterium]|nr:CoA transferase subunit A [candidate division Zixibacteria bacterium]